MIFDDNEDDGSSDNDSVYGDDTNNDDDKESLFIGPLIGLPPGVHNGKEVWGLLTATWWQNRGKSIVYQLWCLAKYNDVCQL